MTRPAHRARATSGAPQAKYRWLRAVMLAVGAVAIAVGVLGLLFDWGSRPGRSAALSGASLVEPSTSQASVATTSTPGVPTTAAAPSSTAPVTAPTENPQDFLKAFVHALRTGDRAFLFDRMHPAVLARYGAAQCQAETARLLDPSADLRIDSVSGPYFYAWTTESRTTVIPNTYIFQVEGTVRGTPRSTRQYHLPVVDGKFRILADCGVPLATG